MASLRLENCVRIGYFQRTHGIEGTLVLDFSPEWGPSLASTTILILEINGLPVPWFIAEYGIRITSANTALVDLEWIEDDASAQKLCGLKVFLEKKEVIPAGKDQNYGTYEGFTIVDEQDEPVGLIIAENDYSGNFVFSVKTKKGTILVPYHPDLLIKADARQKKLTMQLPPGLPGI